MFAMLIFSQKIIIFSKKFLRKSFLFNFMKFIVKKFIAKKFIAKKFIAKKFIAEKFFIIKITKFIIFHNIRENFFANIFNNNENEEKLMK